MGINILILKVTGIDRDENWSFGVTRWYTTEEVKWWDSLRQAGDRDFINNVDRVYITKLDDDDDNDYWRPGDFEAARHWVVINVENPARLLEALEKMEHDEMLFFRISW